jgi:hypothetical protein
MGSGTPKVELEPDHFDVIYCYPWPGEIAAIESIFERRARVGAMLVTYQGEDGFRLRRKLPAKRRRSRQ